MAALLRLRCPPTAVVCSNDWTAIGALHAIHAAGLRVPQDVSVVGFDDIPLAQLYQPRLDDRPHVGRDVGATAFDALFRLIGEERLRGTSTRSPPNWSSVSRPSCPKRK